MDGLFLLATDWGRARLPFRLPLRGRAPNLHSDSARVTGCDRRANPVDGGFHLGVSL
jgi:hypothetical protein